MNNPSVEKITHNERRRVFESDDIRRPYMQCVPDDCNTRTCDTCTCTIKTAKFGGDIVFSVNNPKVCKIFAKPKEIRKPQRR